MSKLLDVLKGAASDNADVLLLLRVLVFLNAGKSVGDFARLVDMMINQGVNPFAELARVNPQVIEEVLDVITELDKPVGPTTISAPPEQPPVGLMDGDTIAPVNGNGKARAQIVRKLLIEKYKPGMRVRFDDIIAPVFDPTKEDGTSAEIAKRGSEVGAALVQQFKKDGLLTPVEGKRGLYIRMDLGKRKLKMLMRRT
jgi:hypothetical protein